MFSRAFSRALRKLHVVALRIDWFNGLLVLSDWPATALVLVYDNQY